MGTVNLQPVILIRLQCGGNDNVNVDQFNMSFVYPLLLGATTGIPRLALHGQVRFAAGQDGGRTVIRGHGDVCIAFTPVADHRRSSRRAGTAAPFLRNKLATGCFVRIQQPKETIREQEELPFLG